jgi:hypothetical protein
VSAPSKRRFTRSSDTKDPTTASIADLEGGPYEEAVPPGSLTPQQLSPGARTRSSSNVGQRKPQDNADTDKPAAEILRTLTSPSNARLLKSVLEGLCSRPETLQIVEGAVAYAKASSDQQC